MKFPYGISDFREIVTQKYFYCDRTDRIPLIERGKYLLFLRPRRFGKSLLLSMLANYYDVAKKDEFDHLFGQLAVAKNPTPNRNRYFVLEWDFSCVDPTGSVQEIKRALHNHINGCMEGFAMYYRGFGIPDIRIDPEDALYSIQSLIAAVRTTEHPIYLLIDEYDNFANEVLVGARRDEKSAYEALVFEEGPLRTLFKAVKSSTGASVFDRIFITGVSPVVMSDITSGYNIGENICLDPDFNDLCGFTEAEITGTIQAIAEACELKTPAVEEAVGMMRTYYNGYAFARDASAVVYNPTLAIYFFKSFYRFCKYPRQMLDANLATDEAKLEYIARMIRGRQMLLDLVREDRTVEIPEISDRFGIRKMLSEGGRDVAFMAAFLYYFGILTLKGETPEGKLSLGIPNLVVQRLYAEQIREMLLPEPVDRDEGVSAAERLYTTGDMGPLCNFVQDRFFMVFHNPDYRWANELTLKTAFLTLLYNDILYIMDSDAEIDRRYADLTMIIRPDMRRFKIFDILIEFKFVGLKEAGISGEQARNLDTESLRRIPMMQAEMANALAQVTSYGDALERRHDDLRLRRYGVVSLGFERIWWAEQTADRAKDDSERSRHS